MPDMRFHGLRLFRIIIIVLLTVLRSSCLVTNVALGKPTIQSSSWTGPQAAVDGNTNPDYGQGSCSHTDDLDTQPWWLVDLMHIYLVHYLEIYNRDVNKERLDNLIVEGFLHYPLLTSQAQPQLCAFNSGPSGDIVNLPCSKGTKARYIRLRGPQIMTLCEVKIYGEKTDGEGCDIRRVERQVGLRIQSSVAVVDLGHTNSPIGCSILCVQRPDCRIFNYNVVNGDCKVPVDLISNGMVVSDSDWNLYSM